METQSKPPSLLAAQIVLAFFGLFSVIIAAIVFRAHLVGALGMLIQGAAMLALAVGIQRRTIWAQFGLPVTLGYLCLALDWSAFTDLRKPHPGNHRFAIGGVASAFVIGAIAVDFLLGASAKRYFRRKRRGEKL